MLDPFRLPHVAVPSRYRLRIEPDLGSASFSGRVEIDVDVHEPTAELVCNAIELEIHSAEVDGLPVRFELDAEHERVSLQLDQAVSAGSHVVSLVFTGILNDKLRGFYRSTWTDDDGVEHVLGTTQMQATDARRAFPCWDEPEFKAVFSLTLVIDEHLEAVANSPEIGRTIEGGKVSITYGDTMSMSTYLVAWVVGELEMTDPVDVDGIALRVVHVPGKSHLTAFALDCGAFGLRWFQDYYGIAYPGDKVDLVALPDFAAGAMENLGCITFRETLLLVDPVAATQADQQLVADVVLHELAHMWFGDLVTMRWWNGIWLNEAFATFMEVAATDAYRPDWHRWDTFGIERTGAFDVDGLAATRAVEFDVVSPADAQGMFDVLTYQKGGALLRMLEQYLGPDRFRDGIRRYLRTHAYGSTETADLWDALEAETGEPVRSLMDSWIWQGGYPMVSARVEGTTLVLGQERFLLGPADPDDAGTARLWSVPIIVRNGSSELRVLLTGDDLTVELPEPAAAVLVNAGGHGFYRVRYSSELVGRLDGAVLGVLGSAERFGLVDDAWSSTVAGHSSAGEFCSFIRRFADETELATWRIMIGALSWCDRFVEGPTRQSFQNFVRALLAPALARIGWEPEAGEADLVAEVRGALVRALAVLGADPDARARARQLHERALAGERVEPSLAAAALSVVATEGDADDHRRYVEGFERAATPQESLRFLYALAEFPHRSEMDATLALLTSERVKTQNAPFVLGRCLANRDLGPTVWEFVAANWQDLDDRFPDASMIRMLEGVRTLTRDQDVAAVASFFSEHALPQAGKTLAQHLERQRVNAALRTRATESLNAAFG